MLLMGDEVRRTQLGNNNAYCQDNEISWFDWSLLDKHADIYRFARRLIRLRRNLDVFTDDHGLSLNELLQRAQIQWHGIKVNAPDWAHGSHSAAFAVRGRRALFYVVVNAWWKPLAFELPPGNHGAANGWRRIIDTSLESPDDFCEPSTAPLVPTATYMVAARSVVVLAAELLRRSWSLGE